MMLLRDMSKVDKDVMVVSENIASLLHNASVQHLYESIAEIERLDGNPLCEIDWILFKRYNVCYIRGRNFSLFLNSYLAFGINHKHELGFTLDLEYIDMDIFLPKLIDAVAMYEL